MKLWVMMGVLAGTGLCVFAAHHGALIFVAVAVLGYMALLFRRPEMGLLLAVLGICHGFSMVHDDFLRLPGLFKMRDLFLVSAMVPLVQGLYLGDPRVRKTFSNPFGVWITVFLCLVCVQILLTKFRFPETELVDNLKEARKYFYFGFFYPLHYTLSNPERLRIFLRGLTAMGLLFSLAYLLQFVIGPQVKIFRGAIVMTQNLQGFLVTRQYIQGYTLGALVFQGLLMVMLLQTRVPFVVRRNTALLVTGMQTLVTFGRAHIFGVAAGSLFAFFLSRRMWDPLRWTRVFLCVMACLLVLQFSLRSRVNLFEALLARVTSTYTAIVERKETVGYRIEESRGRFQLIRRYPYLGIGFIHDESHYFTAYRGYDHSLRTTDSGLITILLDFGFWGLLWIAALFLVTLRRSMIRYRATQDHVAGALVLGCAAFIYGRIFSCITLADFILPDGIIFLVVAAVVLECVEAAPEESPVPCGLGT